MVAPAIVAAGIGAGGSILGGLFGSNAADEAGGAQLAATREQIAFARETEEADRAERDRYFRIQQRQTAPMRRMARRATEARAFEMGLKKRAPDGYTPYSLSKGAAFAIDKAQEAIEASAAARGGLLSGATADALMEDAQGRAALDRNTHIAQLGQIAAPGAPPLPAPYQSRYGGAVINAIGQGGQARADSIMQGSNAFGQGFADAAAFGGYAFDRLRTPTSFSPSAFAPANSNIPMPRPAYSAAPGGF